MRMPPPAAATRAGCVPADGAAPAGPAWASSSTRGRGGGGRVTDRAASRPSVTVSSGGTSDTASGSIASAVTDLVGDGRVVRGKASTISAGSASTVGAATASTGSAGTTSTGSAGTASAVVGSTAVTSGGGVSGTTSGGGRSGVTSDSCVSTTSASGCRGIGHLGGAHRGRFRHGRGEIDGDLLLAGRLGRLGAPPGQRKKRRRVEREGDQECESGGVRRVPAGRERSSPNATCEAQG